MTFNEQDINREQDGQFGRKLGAPSEIALARDEAGHSFPIPQADRLDKVAVSVDAIAAGANTPAAVAESLDMDERLGSMYGDAAGYIGLVTASGSPKTYDLTPLGEAFVAATPAERGKMMNTLVADTDIVQEYNDRGASGVEELIEERGYSGTTISRRGQTAAAWAAAVAGGETLDLTDEIAATRGRAAIAAAKIRTNAAPEVCTGCWMEKPTSGDCGC